MITLLSELDFEHFSPRVYIVAQTDETSQQRVKQLETNKKSRGNEVFYYNNIQFIDITQPRSSSIMDNYSSLYFCGMHSVIFCIVEV